MANEKQFVFSLDNYIEEINKLRMDSSLLVFPEKSDKHGKSDDKVQIENDKSEVKNKKEKKDKKKKEDEK